MAENVWKDEKGMLAIAKYQAEQTLKKYKEKSIISNKK